MYVLIITSNTARGRGGVEESRRAQFRIKIMKAAEIIKARVSIKAKAFRRGGVMKSKRGRWWRRRRR